MLKFDVMHIFCFFNQCVNTTFKWIGIAQKNIVLLYDPKFEYDNICWHVLVRYQRHLSEHTIFAVAKYRWYMFWYREMLLICLYLHSYVNRPFYVYTIEDRIRVKETHSIWLGTCKYLGCSINRWYIVTQLSSYDVFICMAHCYIKPDSILSHKCDYTCNFAPTRHIWTLLFNWHSCRI